MATAWAPPGAPEAPPCANQSCAPQDLVLLGFAHVLKLRPLLAALFLVVFLLTLLGNALVVLLTALDPALRAPMYFLLRHLALLEICFSLDVAPRLLGTLLRPGRGVSPAGCALQLVLVLSCVPSERFLLTAMAWDRYGAICRPLRYGAIMSPRLCHLLAATCWLAGVPVSLVFTIWLFPVPFCGPRGIRHFFCDIAPLLSLVCADTRVFEASVLAGHSAGHHGSLLSDSHVLHWGLGHRAPDAIRRGAPQGPVHMRLPPHRGGSVLWHHGGHPLATQGQLLPREQAGDVPVLHPGDPHAQPPHLQPSEQGGEGCPGTGVCSEKRNPYSMTALGFQPPSFSLCWIALPER
ncbi:olfactory receptor 10A2-like [Leptonychotes weddellii]|uniref:Olfactory receptor 10A2-like n=1 Tax=Leptonychotes weddellii TaxID=9713 RepID=A0A7F8QQC3_LEPWE|nr:olfactory receptor 10A2-like [Leptonychotes weddellii]